VRQNRVKERVKVAFPGKRAIYRYAQDDLLLHDPRAGHPFHCRARHRVLPLQDFSRDEYPGHHEPYCGRSSPDDRQFPEGRRGDLGFVLNTNSYGDLTDPEKSFAVFAQLQRYSNAFVDLGVFDQDGIHVSTRDPTRLVASITGRRNGSAMSCRRDTTSATFSLGLGGFLTL